MLMMLYDFSLSQLKTKPGSMHICTYKFITTARNNVMNDEKSDLQSQRVLLKKIVTFLLQKCSFFLLSQCGQKIPAVRSSRYYYIPPL